MRIYYNEFSTITRYHFGGDLEAIGEISLTPEPILLNSLICYYEDLEEGTSFRGNFKNPKIYKQYVFEICEKYKNSYNNRRRLYDRNVGEEILLDNKWTPVPNDFYESKKVYILGELIREDKYYYKNKVGSKNFYYTDEMIEYLSKMELNLL